MNIVDYEAQGGFSEELGVVRNIGQEVTRLQGYMFARPYRASERHAVTSVQAALECLRCEIVQTRTKALAGVVE